MNLSQYEQIRQIVAEYLDVSIDLVVPEASLYQDLGASLDFVEMIMACEEKFHITIPDEEASQLVTVRKLALSIEEKTQPDNTAWPPSPSFAV
jgi:acyl carrier protein